MLLEIFYKVKAIISPSINDNNNNDEFKEIVLFGELENINNAKAALSSCKNNNNNNNNNNIYKN